VTVNLEELRGQYTYTVEYELLPGTLLETGASEDKMNPFEQSPPADSSGG